MFVVVDGADIRIFFVVCAIRGSDPIFLPKFSDPFLVGLSEAYWRMGLRKEYVRLLAAKIAEDLVKQEMIEIPASLDLATQLFEVMDAEINLEDRLNDEVRTMLNQYSNEMRQSGASYQEMFKLIKNKLVKERKLVL